MKIAQEEHVSGALLAPRGLTATAKLHAVTVDKQESFESKKPINGCFTNACISIISSCFVVVHASNANVILPTLGLPSSLWMATRTRTKWRKSDWNSGGSNSGSGTLG